MICWGRVGGGGGGGEGRLIMRCSGHHRTCSVQTIGEMMLSSVSISSGARTLALRPAVLRARRSSSGLPVARARETMFLPVEMMWLKIWAMCP